MFQGFFRFRSIRDITKRRGIYKVSEEKIEKRKIEQENVDLKSRFPLREDLKEKKFLGLKIVVDSRNSVEKGLYNLIEILKKNNANGTFFISFGREGRERNFFNLINPLFYKEIIKTKSLKLYGFGYNFGLSFNEIVGKETNKLLKLKEEGFEIGAGSFSPPLWVKAVKEKDEEKITYLYNLSIETFEEIFKERCASFSAPFYLCSNATILTKEKFHFDYSSDTRGIDPFFPVIETKALKTPQIPVTLPTVPEWLYLNKNNVDDFYNSIIEEAEKQRYPVFEINPLYEGYLFKDNFELFIKKLNEKGIKIISLRELMGARIVNEEPLPRCTLSYGLVEGRRQIVTIQSLDV